MKKFFLLALFLAACAANPRKPSSELSQALAFFEKSRLGNLPHAQRIGLFLEARDTNLKACVIYLPGLGDSIQNHYPLFNKLRGAGYRVLAFDYLGQGGSEGSMASTRLDSAGDPFPTKRDYEIGVQARAVWKNFSQVSDPVYGRNCAASPKLVIGWSTGGLAAYKLAHEKWADASVLIAPGIVPRVCVGAISAKTWRKCIEKSVTLDQVITLDTLTTRTASEGHDPHLDPIKPNNPLQAKQFAVNLFSTAYLRARHWRMPESSRGLVFLSGKNDTYVNSERTTVILNRHAPAWEIVPYAGALHEIDNETSEISEDMHLRTIQFFDSVITGVPRR